MDNDTDNPLDVMGITRQHLIALREAYTQTNKARSGERAETLLQLFQILQKFDQDRRSLYWDE